jgi:hypothetical protein
MVDGVKSIEKGNGESKTATVKDTAVNATIKL